MVAAMSAAWRGAFWRSAVAVALAWLGLASPTTAQAPWKPDRPVEIIVGTDPGSGNDRSARTLQKIWRSNKLVDVAVTVLNRPGGFGAVAWSYLNTHPRSGTYLAAMSTLMLTNEISGNSPLSYRDFTPLAILLNEEIAIGVYGGSPIKTGRDLLARLKQDPASVSFAVSGIGGQNHIALGLVASPAGVDVAKLKMIGFAGSADSITAVIGGHVEGTAAPASLIAAQVATGRLRALGVGAEHRMSGPLADVPTWREQGIDAAFSNWRGVIGPKGMTPEQVQYWDDIFAKTVETREWKEEVQRSQLTSHYLQSRATGEFLAAENEKLTGVMNKLGLSKEASALPTPR
jgi:putative tricarboxylic transport membrane protein